MKEFTCLEIETLVAQKWNIRQNIIVPNVSWGLGVHECDLLILSKSGYATEIEIKVSKSDLRKDMSKRHGHRNKKIKYLYFAIPEKLLADVDMIPAHAGILVAKRNETYSWIEIFRFPETTKNCEPLTGEDKAQLMRLGCMRIWGLKQGLLNLTNHVRTLKNQLKQAI